MKYPITPLTAFIRHRLVLAVVVPLAMAMSGPVAAQGQPSAEGSMSAEETIKDWPEVSTKAAEKMIEQYGEPDGITDRMLIWHDNGPWSRTIVHKEEIDHRFPIPHKDVLEQFVYYEVPEEKFSDLAKYDGSVVAYRTNGEISARCDKEAANFLALNLADDIVNGERSVEDARAFYAKTVQEMMQGEKPEYVQELRFETQTAAAAGDPDEPFEESKQVASAGEATAGSAESGGQAELADMSAEELRGKQVMSANGEVVGEVVDISQSGAQGEKAAQVQIDAFLGLGERDVMVPLSRLSLTADGNLETTMTEDEISALPEVGENPDEM